MSLLLHDKGAMDSSPEGVVEGVVAGAMLGTTSPAVMEAVVALLVSACQIEQEVHKHGVV